eukprot:TRINITY_DN64903_c0_g2_i1.p1 TRINITY_DN64903_c0_g2~~TRINITY_DN64903_c0_g2_i1.p1  ORF type:complete len:162 (-),score=4.45 TRINITY_DN64903_c0_g2_i1:538-1023(-)
MGGRLIVGRLGLPRCGRSGDQRCHRAGLPRPLPSPLPLNTGGREGDQIRACRMVAIKAVDCRAPWAAPVRTKRRSAVPSGRVTPATPFSPSAEYRGKGGGSDQGVQDGRDKGGDGQDRGSFDSADAILHKGTEAGQDFIGIVGGGVDHGRHGELSFGRVGD